MTKKTKILHIITDLNTGGAEMMLYKLLSAIDKTQFDNRVISLTDDNVVGEKIAALGVPVSYLGMAPGRPDLRRFLRLLQEIRRIRPDAVQTWMYHADLLGGAAAKLAGVKRVVWNIRHSDLPRQHSKRSTRLTAKLCAWLSHLIPDKIVCNAQRAALLHRQLGYKRDAFEIIGNGFDLQRFQPDVQAKALVCRELHIDDADALLVGLVARFDAQKNHAGFIQAAQLLAAQFPQLHFILAGRGVDADNAVLRQYLASSGCDARVHLLGERHDIPFLTAALDVAVSCSIFGEGFPNSVGEAMACGVPCVVSDVGDSAWLLGEGGLSVAPGDSTALAAAIARLLRLSAEQRTALGAKGRQRIGEHFSLPAITERYEALYRSLLQLQ
ncbi:MAG: glycosyltransferase family 4 protein [Gammaproteobacteria bacterium]